MGNPQGPRQRLQVDTVVAAWMGEEWFVSFALWAALLWVVIECFNDRGLRLGGRLAEDVAALEPTLKGFRHAVLHVSERSPMTRAYSNPWERGQR